MKMNKIIRTAALLALSVYATPALAGGVTVAENGDSKLKLGGKIFADLTSHKVTDAAGKTTTSTKGTRIERAYFTAKYYFDQDWMMRITTDVVLNPAVDKNGKTVSKNNNIFLKYAYVEGKLMGDALNVRFGQSHTPWIDYEQGLWKHRYFSKVMIDTNKYDASSDLGIGFKGKLAGGMAKYFVTYTNGAGYSHPGTVTGAMDIDSRFGIYPIEGLTLDVQFRRGYKGTKAGNVVGTESTLQQIMATYGSGHDYRVGVNYITNKNVDTATPANNLKDTAYAVWGWSNLGDGMGVFGRYEYTKDNNATSANIKSKKRLAGGFEYSPAKHVTVSLGYDKTTKLTGGIKQSNDTRIGLWTQTKF